MYLKLIILLHLIFYVNYLFEMLLIKIKVLFSIKVVWFVTRRSPADSQDCGSVIKPFFGNTCSCHVYFYLLFMVSFSFLVLVLLVSIAVSKTAPYLLNSALYRVSAILKCCPNSE